MFLPFHRWDVGAFRLLGSFILATSTTQKLKWAQNDNTNKWNPNVERMSAKPQFSLNSVDAVEKSSNDKNVRNHNIWNSLPRIYNCVSFVWENARTVATAAAMREQYKVCTVYSVHIRCSILNKHILLNEPTRKLSPWLAMQKRPLFMHS